MKGVDELTSRLARLARPAWIVGSLAACIAAAFGIYRVAASYGIDDIPDRGFAYTAAEAAGLLARLGEAGRHGLLLLHAFDHVYVVAYALFFGIALAGIARRLRPSSVRLRRLAVLPVLAALADLFENACVDVAVVVFPGRSDLLLSLAGGLTTLKATLLAVVELLLVLGLIALSVRFIGARLPRRDLRTSG